MYRTHRERTDGTPIHACRECGVRDDSYRWVDALSEKISDGENE